jgi:hypothetical protein
LYNLMNFFVVEINGIFRRFGINERDLKNEPG